MTYQQLFYFYQLTKTLNFSKAAQNCFVAQTAISKQIQHLESEFGLMLFRRNGKQLELTAAGDNLRVFAERILLLWDESIESTKRIGHIAYEKTPVTVGYWGCIESTNFTSVFDDFLKSEPNCMLYYTHIFLDNIPSCLIKGTADFIIAPKAHVEKFKEIELKTLVESPFGIVMREDHPLAGKEKLYPIDIINETFIQRIIASSEGLCNSQQKCWEQMSFYPQNFVEVNEYKSALMMVSNGMGVTLSPEYVDEIKGKRLVYKRIEGLTHTENISLGYLPRSDNMVVNRMISYFRNKK